MTRWIVVNALAFGLGFAAIMQVVNIIEFGQLEWSENVGTGIRAYLARPLSLFAAGAVLGVVQAMLLKTENIEILAWTFTTALGFSAATLLIWPLMATGNWGDTAAPIEPIVNVIGGGTFAGVAQYFYLRRQSIYANKWLVFWIAGLIVSIFPRAAFFILFPTIMDISFSWPVEVFINGSINGAVAAAISGAVFFRTLGTAKELK